MLPVTWAVWKKFARGKHAPRFWKESEEQMALIESTTPNKGNQARQTMVGHFDRIESIATAIETQMREVLAQYVLNEEVPTLACPTEEDANFPSRSASIWTSLQRTNDMLGELKAALGL